MNALTGIALGLATLVSMVAAPKHAESGQTALDVTKSSVTDDLEAFYGESYGDKILSNLTPSKAKGDDYSDFKFYNFYPYRGDLYFYFYARAGFKIDSVILEYSDGSSFDSEGNAIENWHMLGESGNNAAIVQDTYGKMNIFYKCVLKDFYEESEGSKHRIFLSTLNGYTSNDSELLFSRRCQDAELLWEDTAESEDLIYKYYKDDYILIDQAEYMQQWLCTRWNDSNQSFPIEVTEFNWLFFSWSGTSIGGKYELGELKEVVLDYEYLTYDATYIVDSQTVLSPETTPVYFGTHDHPEVFTENVSGVRIRGIEIGNEVYNVRQSTITPYSRRISTITDEPEWWQFWLNAHKVEYTYNSIQALDQTSIASIEDEDTRDFFQSQSGIYKYAIMMKEDRRQRTKVEDLRWTGWNEFWSASKKVTSKCHELISPRLTRLTFNTIEGDVELNAMMHPVELTGVFSTSGNVIELKDYVGPSAKDVLRYAFYALAGLLVVTAAGFGVVAVLRFAKRGGLLERKPKGHK